MARPHFSYPEYLSAQRPVREHRCDAVVAFRDCDPMGVLWHGNYLAYCELARHALGEAIGLGLRRLVDLGLYAPVVRSQVVHHLSVLPDDRLMIKAELFPTTQPRLYHRYRFSRGTTLVAEAETEQVLTRRDMTMLLQQPEELGPILRGP